MFAAEYLVNIIVIILVSLSIKIIFLFFICTIKKELYIYLKFFKIIP